MFCLVSFHRRRTTAKSVVLEAIMRRIFSILGTVLMCVTLALAQTPGSRQASAFGQQLIDRQKQFLEAFLNKNAAAVDSAVADDFQGIQANGDFYDKGEVVE